ncbi:MAG: beta-lactamase family protein [Gemmatimonadota bacterium]|nr:beta-lactamase family protein [Gemmatimonadota bacterium]
MSTRAGVARALPIALFVVTLSAALGTGSHAQVSSPVQAAPSPRSAAALAGALDRAARSHAQHPTVAGVSVAVVRGDETLLHRGYGFVDLEWGVRTPLDGGASYEIGSVTKQFTAAAILLLVEEGKLDLSADVTEYLDFDTGGRSVPIRRLLDHTSGIRSYTEMSVFGELTPFALPRDTLVGFIEREPFDFEPGAAQIYNNSAYFLLGLIIERISGTSYEDFVTERLFRPAGMMDSYYCSESAIRSGRAHGYDAVGPESLIRARYLDHTWPYAAGSLCSTVGDLIAWNRALHGGSILAPASYRAMVSPVPLEDGTRIRYAMGLAVDSLAGHPEVGHGGGINGFVSQLTYYPDQQLSVVVLQNSTGPQGAGALANRLAETVLGPITEPEGVPFAGALESLTGTYSGAARGQDMEVQVTVEDGRLTLRSGGPSEVHPVHRGAGRWDAGRTRYLFEEEGPTGIVRTLRVDLRSGHYILRRVGD